MHKSTLMTRSATWILIGSILSVSNSLGDLYITPISSERVALEAAQLSQKSETRPVTDAFESVEDLKKTVVFLDENKLNQAKTSLMRSIKKANLALRERPKADLIPLSVDVQIVDMHADDDSLLSITHEARRMVLSGRYQAARVLLRNIASEINATTVNLPVAYYPGFIREAKELIDQGKVLDGKRKLLMALQSLVVLESIIPLPIIRAEAMIDEANNQAAKKEMNKKEVTALLQDADVQLNWAEKLGYGTRKEEFANIHTSIKALKDAINKDRDFKTLFSKTAESLLIFKNKFSNSRSGEIRQAQERR